MGGGYRRDRPSYAAMRSGNSEAASRDRGRQLKEYTTTGYKPRAFISFSMSDEAQVNFLRYQARNSDKLEFTDYSVKQPFDEAWKTQCTERIRQSSVVVVPIGEDTHTREAVLWEIRKAHELGKQVIGMRIYRDKNHKIPEPMREYGDKVIEWTLDTLQKEIDESTR